MKEGMNKNKKDSNGKKKGKKEINTLINAKKNKAKKNKNKKTPNRINILYTRGIIVDFVDELKGSFKFHKA